MSTELSDTLEDHTMTMRRMFAGGRGLYLSSVLLKVIHICVSFSRSSVSFPLSLYNKLINLKPFFPQLATEKSVALSVHVCLLDVGRLLYCCHCLSRPQILLQQEKTWNQQENDRRQHQHQLGNDPRNQR